MKKLINVECKLVLFSIFLFGFNKARLKSYPVYFEDYRITISEIPKLGDTLNYNKSGLEYFKFVFYDTKGKCYCERYINNKIFEMGYYENSLDTLKRYVSGRFPHGKTSPIYVEAYFEPLKNGVWIIYKNKKVIKQRYLLGILQDNGLK